MSTTQTPSTKTLHRGAGGRFTKKPAERPVERIMRSAKRARTAIQAEPEPLSPGRLLERKMAELKLNNNQLGKHLGLNHGVVARLRAGMNITAELALRLALAFGDTVQYWLLVQAEHDLWLLRRSGKATELGAKILPIG